MSAAQLDLAWDSRNAVDRLPLSFPSNGEMPWVRPIRRASRPARCPECHSVIYSRRHRLCGFCGEPLPDYLLFSTNEATRIEQLLRTERQRHRQWMRDRTVH